MPDLSEAYNPQAFAFAHNNTIAMMFKRKTAA